MARGAIETSGLLAQAQVIQNRTATQLKNAYADLAARVKRRDKLVREIMELTAKVDEWSTAHTNNNTAVIALGGEAITVDSEPQPAAVDSAEPADEGTSIPDESADDIETTEPETDTPAPTPIKRARRGSVVE